MQPMNFDNNALEGHGFWNHVDSCCMQLGVLDGAPLIERYAIWMVSNLQSLSGGGAKPRNLLLVRSVNGSPWFTVKMWQEGVDYQDAAAAGSVSVNPLTGDVSVQLSAGRTAQSGGFAYQPWETTIPRGAIGPPVVWPPTPGGSDARVDGLISEIVSLKARVATLEAQPPSGGTGISGDDRAALDWLKQLRALIQALLGVG